ncbi:hypothetical protein K435DRAFT_849411 [Dendrothele bispora CBS 962.96]|uniref:Uncharacterized protein n=1 Tax=Dendrothele bispora (strain CBS 962.96) TaxID=1314807 RepID=A0A4S8MSF0_DENBC|nr:hypothetical protein K435DRAFT_849411 [Dendrothele bispora CBS 962.96]
MSKASAREYYYTLERLTDNTSTVEIPGCYQELLRMIRQWHLLKVLKRHGRGHDPRGYWATRSAMDANFRLVHLKVSSEDADPGLVNGYQYFVPSKKFQQDLVQFGNYTSENSTQSCNNHKAIGNANMRREAGLDSTGVAATSCSRHGMKLPCSHVDLQVGERFFNMDYSFLSSLMFAAFILLLMGGDVLLSYDVMCSYLVNLFTRHGSYPPHLKPPLTKDHIVGLIPKFHLPGHIPQCGLNYNFNFTQYTGRTHGETIEQAWSNTNALAGSTKVMGPGSH